MQHANKRYLTDPFPELKFLPVFYLFPQELLNSTEFRNFPRNPYTIRNDPKWMKLYRSGKFIETMADGTANMVWRHFGIKAAMESFSGYHPFWVLARMTATWALVAEKFGYNTYSMGMASKTFEYPVRTWENANDRFRQFVERAFQLWPLADWLDAVKQMPCHEDYEPSRPRSKARIDFHRKWYHSRSITKVAYIGQIEKWEELEAPCIMPGILADFQIDYKDFKQTLSETDQNILEWLLRGYTQAEIANALGFANHSPVCKRLQRIKKKYREYMAATDVPLKEYKPVKHNWNELTRLLYPKTTKFSR